MAPLSEVFAKTFLYALNLLVSIRGLSRVDSAPDYPLDTIGKMPMWPTKKLAYECDCGLQNVNQYCATDGENIEYFVTIGEMYLLNDIIINAEICKRGPFFLVLTNL